jgi:hypothetical protein
MGYIAFPVLTYSYKCRIKEPFHVKRTNHEIASQKLTLIVYLSVIFACEEDQVTETMRANHP